MNPIKFYQQLGESDRLKFQLSLSLSLSLSTSLSLSLSLEVYNDPDRIVELVYKSAG